MKKVFFLLVVSAQLAVISNKAKAQTFQTGSLIVAAAYGVDGYATQSHEINKYTGIIQNTTGGAASGNINLGGEFGVARWLGLGLQFKFDNYFLGKDTSAIKSAYGFEYGLIINFHIVRHLHFDFLAGFNIGLSNLTVTSNDGYNDQVYGNGSWDDIHFTTRVYISRFGFSATLYFPTINYSTLTSNNTTYNTYIIDSFKAKGEGLNIGVQYHFLR